MPHVVLDTGPDDRIDHVYRERMVRYSDIPTCIRRAKISDKLQDKITRAPDEKTKILEVVCRDYSVKNEEVYLFYAIETSMRECIVSESYRGIGSNPFICFRWSKCSGEIYGRGPLINALSAIKTTNLTIELILENAQMAISGIYQMDDDGVVNPDTINLVPGTVIPKAAGSAGLQPIRAAGSFDVANLVLSDMRLNIKRALYNDMLGNPDAHQLLLQKLQSVWLICRAGLVLHLEDCKLRWYSLFCRESFTFSRNRDALNCRQSMEVK